MPQDTSREKEGAVEVLYTGALIAIFLFLFCFWVATWELHKRQ
jgi:hypothetical protein